MYQMKRLVLPILVIVLAILACGIPTPATSQLALTETPGIPFPVTNASFSISVEYAILGVANTYTAAGVRYAKLQDVFTIWGNVEPEPGRYEWGPLDAVVLEYQKAGFTGLQMDLSALSPWASSVQPSLGNQGDPFPKGDYLDQYGAFVAAVVERYDHDGVNDMPGLLYPIHDYGIEREFSGFWPGTAAEYIRLLRIAYPAIKSADPEARVLLAALLMTDIFDGKPTPADIQQRLTRNADYMRKSVPDIRAILAACDAYDQVDFHSLGNYTEIPLTITWIRQELQSNGCGNKSIWIGDAFPMSGLVGYGGLVPPIAIAPVTLDTRQAVETVLQAVADPSEKDHVIDQAWLYAETATGLTRKIIVSAAAGVSGINIGNMEDWKTGVPGVDKAAVPLLGASMFMGLTDTTVTNQKPGGTLPYTGKDWSKARQAGDLRPAWYALALVTNKIGGFTSVQQLDSASLSGQDKGSGIWTYRFETSTGPVWVLWYDDGALHLPGETRPAVTISMAFESASTLLTTTPTEIGQTGLEIKTLSTIGGKLTFDLGATPVFIQEVP
jgi:hypothetical protein